MAKIHGTNEESISRGENIPSTPAFNPVHDTGGFQAVRPPGFIHSVFKNPLQEKQLKDGGVYKRWKNILKGLCCAETHHGPVRQKLAAFELRPSPRLNLF